MKKIKITEVIEKYIGCNECEFERSYRITGIEENLPFHWNCPKCQKSWIGQITEDYQEISVKKNESGNLTRHIVIELDKRYKPLILMTIPADDSKEMTEPEAFYIEDVQVNENINPLKHEQFKTNKA